MRRQLSRWTSAGQLNQLRCGLYVLAPPYRKVKPHPFLVANRMVRASYVSCQSALAHFGLIPEYVPVVTSATESRLGHWDTPPGSFQFRHIKGDSFWGYRLTGLGNDQRAFVAAPEKALLDLVYLQPGGDAPRCLRALRLQNLDHLDLEVLQRQGDRAGSPKLCRAAEFVADLARREALEYETL